MNVQSEHFRRCHVPMSSFISLTAVKCGFFKVLPRPNKTQLQQLSQKLGLEPKQIKVWFENRRKKQKEEDARADTEALKVENEKLQSENLAMIEAIADAHCRSCLMTENVKRTQLEIMSNNVDKNIGKQISITQSGLETVLNIQGNRFSKASQLVPSMDVEIEAFGLIDVTSPEGKATLIHLSMSMVKLFVENVNKLEVLPDFSNIRTDKVQVSVHNSYVPSGNIVMAASSLWLGLSQESLFDFFDDEKNRYQWDFYTGTSSLKVLTHIPTETRRGNRVSIFQDSGPRESTLLLQSSYNHPSSFSIIYAPIEVQALRSGMINIPTFSPTGFIISDVPHLKNSGDEASTSSSSRTTSAISQLTMICQMSLGHVNEPWVIAEAEAALTNIITSKMMNIKAALNC